MFKREFVCFRFNFVFYYKFFGIVCDTEVELTLSELVFFYFNPSHSLKYQI